jgi:hypothetical protein
MPFALQFYSNTSLTRTEWFKYGPTYSVGRKHTLRGDYLQEQLRRRSLAGNFQTLGPPAVLPGAPGPGPVTLCGEAKPSWTRQVCRDLLSDVGPNRCRSWSLRLSDQLDSEVISRLRVSHRDGPSRPPPRRPRPGSQPQPESPGAPVPPGPGRRRPPPPGRASAVSGGVRAARAGTYWPGKAGSLRRRRKYDRRQPPAADSESELDLLSEPSHGP